MNSIMQTQANMLDKMCLNTETNRPVATDLYDLQAHLYLEGMHVPVDIQDKIINAIHRLKSINSDKILIIIEHCNHSAISEKLSH